jgi:hypothetical protein
MLSPVVNMRSVLALFLVLLSQQESTTSFIIVSVQPRSNRFEVRLYGKKPSSRVKGGGGTTKRSSNKDEKQQRSIFGKKVVETTVKADDDYAIFPALEQPVFNTMIPSIPLLFYEAGVLPDEMYDRLNQIYGFPDFNYLQESSSKQQSATASKEETPVLSFEDLMSVASSSSSSSDPLDGLFRSTKKTSKPLNNDLNELLSLATGSSNDPSDLSSFTKKDSPSSSSSSSAYECLQKLQEFTDFRVLHIDPMVLAIDNFFTDEECDRYIELSERDISMSSRSPTVGKDSYAKAQRTSTTFYHPYENVPELMAKSTRLLGLDTINRWEEPQTVRYRKNEKFTWHLDALGPRELLKKSSPSSEPSGQRLATLLVYLTDLSKSDGGATIFRDLRGVKQQQQEQMDDATEGIPDTSYLAVQPKKGSALLFFPAAGGIPDTPFDIRTIHCGESVASDATNDKWIAQLWLRAGPYEPSAPPGNLHSNAIQAITDYCNRLSK